MRSHQFTTVTPFSKALAAVLFILLPFVGFYLGIRYQKAITPPAPRSNQIRPIDTLTLSPQVSPTSILVPTLVPGAPYKLLSTKAWQNAQNSLISLKYPEQFYRVSANDQELKLVPKSGASGIRMQIANNYQGDSPKAWFLAYYQYSPLEIGKTIILEERKIGAISALVVTNSGSSTPREVIVAHGKTLVDILLQGESLSPTLETIISTIKFK